MARLFEEDKAKTVVVCHPSKIDEVKEDFKG